MSAFRPFFSQPDLATIAGNFWPRPEHTLPATRTEFATEPGIRVMALTQSPPDPQGDLIILHGLEGSHDSGYMRSLAHAAHQQNLRTHRLNMRGCGGTEALAPTLYHAGLTTDLHHILRQLDRRGPVYLAGFSLGGNVVLKLMGELGNSPLVTAAAAISTPLDLEACCRRMMHPRNRLYESRFVTRLKERYRARHVNQPDHYAPYADRLPLLDQVRTVFDFDDVITAPYFAFGRATDYYGSQSSGRFLSAIQKPTLVIQAQDDPLIPWEVYQRHAWDAYPAIRLLAPAHGGHVGFISRSTPRFWVDATVLRFFSSLATPALNGFE